MGEYLNQIPEEIQEHIKQITKSSGLPDNEESIEKIAEGWLEKKRIFEEQIQSAQMEEIDSFEKDDEKGAIALTYSGSLVNIGPLVDNARTLEYTSVGMRADVPQSVTEESAKLASDINVDAPIKFDAKKLQATSAIFKIAVCQDNVNIADQIEKIAQATQILEQEFVKVNKTIVLE